MNFKLRKIEALMPREHNFSVGPMAITRAPRIPERGYLRDYKVWDVIVARPDRMLACV